MLWQIAYIAFSTIFKANFQHVKHLTNGVYEIDNS